MIKRGFYAVDDGTIDKSSAVVGIEDASKLLISFDTQKKDPERSGHFIRGERAIYNYLEHHTKPDWNKKNDVHALNAWRCQVLKRASENIRKTRSRWLQSERDAILALAADQLQHQATVKWNRLGNTYNATQYNTLQPAGEEYLSKGNKKSAMTEDPSAPWRKSSGIKAFAIKWNEFKQLLRDMEEKRQENTEEDNNTDESEDDDEVSDPILMFWSLRSQPPPPPRA